MELRESFDFDTETQALIKAQHRLSEPEAHSDTHADCMTKTEFENYRERLERFLGKLKDHVDKLEGIISANQLTDDYVSPQTGKVLCKVCRTKSHNPKFDCCFDCKDKKPVAVVEQVQEGTKPCPVRACKSVIAERYQWCKSCDTLRRQGVRLELEEPDNEGIGHSVSGIDELEA